MRKCRLYSLLRKTLSALLCLSMMLSIVTVTDFSGLFHFTEKVKAADAPNPNEYEDETLEHVWDPDEDGDPKDDVHWNSARSYYACAVSNGTFVKWGGVYKRTIFHVYAFEGETICLGSNVCNSGLGLDHKLKTGLTACGGNDRTTTAENKHYKDEGSVDIILTDLKGNQIPIDVRNSVDDKTGYIASPKAEFAAVKMKMNKDGTFDAKYDDATYTPYTYKVKESGLYTIEFHSYDGTGTENPNGRFKMSDQWPTADDNYVDNVQSKNSTTGNMYYRDTGGLVAALNITVFDENCEKQTGRAYTDYLSLQMANTGNNVTDTYYILTTDSYIYRMKFNNARPYTYNFFSNNKGIFDEQGNIIYKSVKDLSNDNYFERMGATFISPGNKETDKDKSFYIFLEYPDDKLEGEIYQKAVLPDPATDIKFLGWVEDESGNTVPGAYEGVGGYFSFKVKEATTATLRLEFKGALADKHYVPVEISGAVKPNSTNKLLWNGCDGAGTVIPPDTYNFNDIVYTVTAKAGEIHFPILDMEDAPGGITFTRMSHIYDKDGTWLDTPGTIYDKTKNVIYYDETAIYYGEYVSGVGDESQVDVAKSFFSGLSEAERGKKYYTYSNMQQSTSTNKFGEYDARQSNYIQSHPEIRVGDHSHTTNVINYFDDRGNVLKEDGITPDQQNMIDYLSTDTAHYPAGRSANSNKGSTTDYAIANFWTFIPAKPATAVVTDDELHIVGKPDDKDIFKLSARVFYDANKSGIYEETGEQGEHLMNGVTLNLYKKTEDTSLQSGKKYFNLSEGKMTVTPAIGPDTYELVDSEITEIDGTYVFTNLEYDKTKGTEYLYEVVKPNSSYDLTSGSTHAKALKSTKTDATYYGYYASHSFNDSYSGTEIQKIKVGGTGVNPKILTYKVKEEDVPNTDNSVCTVDVGYYYTPLSRSLALKKEWNTTETTPDAVVYEVSYSSGSSAKVYEYHTLSAGGSWASKNQFLDTVINGSTVDDYYVSREFFVYKDYIYEYKFNYDSAKNKYKNFLSSVERVSLDKVFEDASVEKPVNCSISDIPDLNGDGKSDGADMGKITGWESVDDKKVDCYRAVLDRNMLSDSNAITVTNSINHGTIELYKYHDENDKDESNALQGATFRLYQADKEETMANIEDDDWVNKHYVGSATTRVNGRLTFTGLDPDKTYTVREMFAPDGYRILQAYYEVRPKGDNAGKDEFTFNFDEEDYAQFAVGNAPADTSLKIRKRIEGRSWQHRETGTADVPEDEFSFNISCKFDSTSEDSDIKVNNEEYDILKIDNAEAQTRLKTFADGINSSINNTVQISDRKNEYYSYTVKEEGRPSITYTSADTKMSDELLTGSTSKADSAPKFQNVVFPMAGEYTFTITEENPTTDDVLNLEHSTYTYKVTVAVVRKFNPDVSNPETTDMTNENTHLEAEVSNIVYRENNDAAFKTFSGSSPLFTNTYKTAPAEQKTSYNIVKEFTGRTGDKWKSNDEFTVEIRSADSETIDAVKNGNLSISGFDSTLKDLKELPDGTGWEYTFKSENYEKPLKFNSFKFEDIEFPVQYVYADGTVWTPPEGSEQTTPTDQEIEVNKLTPKTLPVTYKFTIKEKIPEDNKKGITYDESEYTLTIVLNNTVESTNPDELVREEENGIIEEIDVTLSTKDSEGNEISSKCETRQGVLDRETWLKETSSTYGDAVTFWYVDPTTGTLKKRPDTNPDTNTPSDTRLYFWKYENHSSTSGTIFGIDGHTITIKNKYHTSYDWIPTIVKTLDGRDWLDDDEFKFTIEHDSDYSEGAESGYSPDDKDGYSMPDDKTVTIKEDTPSHTASLTSPIKFIKEGTYHFIITEKAKIDTTDIELGKYKITVDVSDDGEGKLLPTITNDKAEDLKDKVIKFTNVYSDKTFALNIAKTIEGREWDSTDNFTFKITPDDNTQTAIDDGIIKMPDGVTPDGGSYTVKLIGDGTGPEFVKLFGDITIKNTGELKVGTQYKFTIEEVTEGLKEMYCREPSIDLFITITELPSSHTGTSSKNGITATFAHVATGGTAAGGTEEDSVKIPFTNVAAGKLTVAKKVVSNSETDETAFGFSVEFKYYAAGTTEKDRVIKATSDGGKEITPDKSSDENTWTYTFDLKDGEKVEFSNIPPKTEYKITETIKDTDKENYMLLRVCGAATDNGIDLRKDGTGESVNGTLNPENNGSENNQYRLFVNGLIRELPSAGGGGIDHIIFLGTAFTVSAILLIAISYYKRRRRV